MEFFLNKGVTLGSEISAKFSTLGAVYNVRNLILLFQWCVNRQFVKSLAN